MPQSAEMDLTRDAQSRAKELVGGPKVQFLSMWAPPVHPINHWVAGGALHGAQYDVTCHTHQRRPKMSKYSIRDAFVAQPRAWGLRYCVVRALWHSLGCRTGRTNHPLDKWRRRVCTTPHFYRRGRFHEESHLRWSEQLWVIHRAVASQRRADRAFQRALVLVFQTSVHRHLSSVQLLWIRRALQLYKCHVTAQRSLPCGFLSRTSQQKHALVRYFPHQSDRCQRQVHVTLVKKSCHTYEGVESRTWPRHDTHMNEACHTYEWVMSFIGMPHIRISHVTRWVMSRIWMIYVTHMNESCHTYECVMSHIWMRHVTHMNDSCHTHEWVMSHVWMSHVTHMNESCHTYEWVMSHIWMSHVTGVLINGMSFPAPNHPEALLLHEYGPTWCESCHTIDWVISYVWRSDVTHVKESHHTRMSHVIHMNKSCHTYEWVMSLVLMSHVTLMNQWCLEHGPTWLSHGARMGESRHTYEWVSHTCTSYISKMGPPGVGHLYASCHTYEWDIRMKESGCTHEGVMSHMWRSHVM